MVQPDTKVRLLSGIPLTERYDNQRTFTSRNAQTSYFLSKVEHSFNEFTYQRKNSNVLVDKQVDSLRECNYMMFQNDNYSSKWFYAFITDMEYVNPNTTAISFEIDVFQTWQFDIEWKPSFVEREHTRRWNSNGSPVINTIPESVDYGNEYDIVDVQEWQPYGDHYYLVIVSKETLSPAGGQVNDGVHATYNGVPQPLSYYVHPFYLDGNTPSVSIGGNTVALTKVQDLLTSIYTQENAVNNIVSMYITDYIGINPNRNSNGVIELSSNNFLSVVIADDSSQNINTIMVKHLSYSGTIHDFGDKYAGFSSVSESKLRMYPYNVIELTDFKGNRLELKPESINGSNLEVQAIGSLGVQNKVAYRVRDYNTNKLESNEKSIVSMENSVINNDPQDLPIVTDYLASHLQGNRNSIETQKQSAYFNGVLSSGSTLGGVVGGAMVGGVPGAIGGGLLGLGGSIGSTYFQVQQIESQLQDIKNVPPQLSSMGGNTSFDFGNGYKGIYVVKKEIKPEYRKKLTDYFKMYGYKVHELKVPNLKTRQHYNFIRTIGANIVGKVPQRDLVKLREIFDSGITLWHGDYVGDYSLANNEV